jgi:hypothetical protein
MICSTCNGEMTRGFAFVRAEGSSFPLMWSEGDITVPMVGGAVTEGRETHGVTAWRCPDCMRVQLTTRGEFDDPEPA